MSIDFNDIKALLISFLAGLLIFLIDRNPRIYLLYYQYRKYIFNSLYVILGIILLWLYFKEPGVRIYSATSICLIAVIYVLIKDSSQIGKSLYVKNVDSISTTRFIKVNKLKYCSPDQKLNISWATFGNGLEELKKSFEVYSPAISADIFIGINESGLVMASFIAGSLGRKKIGYIKMGGRSQNQKPMFIKMDSLLPANNDFKSIAIFDFEMKSGSSMKDIKDILSNYYPGAKLFVIVMGVSTFQDKLDIKTVNEISSDIENEYKPRIFRYIMHESGIEPVASLKNVTEGGEILGNVAS